MNTIKKNVPLAGQNNRTLYHKSALKSILFCGLIGFSLIGSNEVWGGWYSPALNDDFAFIRGNKKDFSKTSHLDLSVKNILMELGFYNLSEHVIKNGSIFIGAFATGDKIDVGGGDQIAIAKKDLDIIKKDPRVKELVSTGNSDGRYLEIYANYYSYSLNKLKLLLENWLVSKNIKTKEKLCEQHPALSDYLKKVVKSCSAVKGFEGYTETRIKLQTPLGAGDTAVLGLECDIGDPQQTLTIEFLGFKNGKIDVYPMIRKQQWSN